ncbi:hypothetical protein [Duganella radicis]|uniref:Uncharacterized protein n=1 Tax=Duganella radicis TaxID=551988 RepID=A0A6L6PIT3_9BURK|nr:hypothetical protein [Duganella radicis]MTV38467.1 hypothetical protein [Duganella radicis]
MKASTKAALISALIFPGLGHLFLRPARALRGLLFMAPAALVASYIVRQVLSVSLQVLGDLNSGALAADPGAIMARLDAAGSPADNWMVLLGMLCWVGAIADALWLGRRNGD